MKRYAVREIYYTIQGEGENTGRPAVFLRLTGCNLWSGREEDRDKGKGDCARWCFAPGTPILMSDWSQRAIEDVEEGDPVLCATRRRGKLYIEATKVLAKLTRVAPLARWEFPDHQIIGTGDHQVWRLPSGNKNIRQGWAKANESVGFNIPTLATPADSIDKKDCWWRGWLAGVASGDGCFWTLRRPRQVYAEKYNRQSAIIHVTDEYRRFRLAVNNQDLVDVFIDKAAGFGFPLHSAAHCRVGFSGKREQMPAAWITSSGRANQFENWLMADKGKEWHYGFLAGIIDAEGSICQRTISIAQYRTVNAETWSLIRHSLSVCGFNVTANDQGFSIHPRDRGRWKFISSCTPVLARKRNAWFGVATLDQSVQKLLSVSPLDKRGEVVTLTTEAGNYFAAGHLVKNCDTSFFGTDGVNGGVYEARGLSLKCREVSGGKPCLIVLTGGEPLLQADAALVAELHDVGFTKVAVETNGTVEAKATFDHLCVSPKGGSDLVIRAGDELKLVYPQAGMDPAKFADMAFRRFYLQPLDDKDWALNTQATVKYCLDNPQWTLSMQVHKFIGLP